MECRGTGYVGANMSVPYFADGKAQMKKVKEEKDMIKKIDLILDYMKKNNLTEISRKQAETVMDTTYVTARSLLYKSDLFRYEDGMWILLKEQEMINISGNICGLNGCTELMPDKIHQQKIHARDFHNLDLKEYKLARKQQQSKESAIKRINENTPLRIDEVKNYMKTKNMRYIKTSEVCDILDLTIGSAYNHLNNCKDFEKIQPGVFEWKESPTPKSDYESDIDKKKPKMYPENNRETRVAKANLTQQDKTPESVPVQKNTDDGFDIEEIERGAKAIEEQGGCAIHALFNHPLITEETLNKVYEKEDADKATEEITEQNERHKTKEIIQVVILRCPHCGGKLKMKE